MRDRIQIYDMETGRQHTMSIQDLRVVLAVAYTTDSPRPILDRVKSFMDELEKPIVYVECHSCGYDENVPHEGEEQHCSRCGSYDVTVEAA